MENQISIKKAALINGSSKYLSIIIQLFFNAILARLLTPSDYGVVAVVTVFTTFFSFFSDMGIGAAIIQTKSLSQNDIESIYTFTFYLGLILAFIFWLLSYPISLFYGDHIYRSIAKLLSVSLFFSTLNMVPNGILMREKKFVLVGLRTVVVTVITYVVTVIFAFWGWKYYALVLQSITNAIFLFLWNRRSVQLKFHLTFNIISLKKIFGFSSYQFLFNIVNYFARNLDNLLIGRFLSSSSLGYYDKAYQLMLKPVQSFTNVITPVLHPIFSDYQKQASVIYSQYLKIVKILSLIGVGVSVFCFFASREIILILFGDQWINSISAFRILSTCMWAQMVTSCISAIYQSLNSTKMLFESGALAAIVLVIAIVCGVFVGDFRAVACGVAVAYNVSFLINYYFLVKKLFKNSFVSFLFNFKNDIIIAIIMVFVNGYFGGMFSIDNIYMSFMLKGIYNLCAYLIGLLVTKEYKRIRRKG